MPSTSSGSASGTSASKPRQAADPPAPSATRASARPQQIYSSPMLRCDPVPMTTPMIAPAAAVGGDETIQQLRPVGRHHAEGERQRYRRDYRKHGDHPALESLWQLGLDDRHEDPVHRCQAKAESEHADAHQQQIRPETCQHREQGQPPSITRTPSIRRHRGPPQMLIVRPPAAAPTPAAPPPRPRLPRKGRERKHQRGHQDDSGARNRLTARRRSPWRGSWDSRGYTGNPR